jgi:hypothetical protein
MYDYHYRQLAFLKIHETPKFNLRKDPELDTNEHTQRLF